MERVLAATHPVCRVSPDPDSDVIDGLLNVLRQLAGPETVHIYAQCTGLFDVYLRNT